MIADSRFEAAPAKRTTAVPLATYAQSSPRMKQINQRALYVLRKAPDALSLTHDLLLENDREKRLESELLDENTVMAATKVAFEAHVPWLEKMLDVPGTQLKFGRGGCSKWCGKQDMMTRPLVHSSSPESDTGSHSTNEGCMPAYSRFVLIGDGEMVQMRNVESVKASKKGFSYELLQKAEREVVELARARFGAAKIKNKAGGDNGREQYAPHRYIYVNICRPGAASVLTPPTAVAAAQDPSGSPEARLALVKRVLDLGYISEDEAAKKRQCILDEM